MRILLAEADQALGAFLCRNLQADGHDVCLIHSGAEILTEAFRQEFDLLLMDLELSRVNDSDVLEAIRKIGNGMRVIVLASRAAEAETRIHCLEAGADDCMVKPFALRELKARCRALLRRREHTSAVLRCGGLELNRMEHSVQRENQPVALTNKEFALLECLMLSRGRCVSRASLLERVWNAGSDGNANVVDVYINYLRRKLDTAPGGSLIQTVRGQGYCMGEVVAGAIQ
jgi:DNA-binding response OmpR family regulator